MKSASSTPSTGTPNNYFALLARCLPSLVWLDRVVPSRTGLMASQPQLLHFLIGDLQSGRVFSRQQECFDLQPGFRRRVLDVAQQDQPRAQRFPGPIDADKAEQP